MKSMNATQALTRLKKVLGKNATISDNKLPSSPEQRAADAERRKIAGVLTRGAGDAVEARARELLDNDGEYQRLLKAYADARRALEKIPFDYYRYDAGTISNALGFAVFHVEAKADTLHDLVVAVEHKHKVGGHNTVSIGSAAGKVKP